MSVSSITSSLMALEARWTQKSLRFQLLLLFLLGALGALALPPTFIIPAIIPGFVFLVWSIKRATNTHSAFLLGWALTYGYFAVGLHWIGFALVVELDKFWWVLPLAIVALPAALAIFGGLVTAVVRSFSSSLLSIVLGLAVVWTFMEWVRSWIFTGFPWNQPGLIWTVTDETMQAAAWMGEGILTLSAVAFAALPAAFIAKKQVERLIAICLFIAIPAMLFGGGYARIARFDEQAQKPVESVRLRLVQPNIAQKDKLNFGLAEQHINQMVQLTRQEGFEKITHVIWPEAAVPYFLNREEVFRKSLAQWTAPINGALITGGNRPVEKSESPGQFDIFNALYVIKNDGSIVETFDKTHLVPFGEYMPLKRWLPLEAITGQGSLSEGTGPRTLAIEGLPAFNPMICYEGIFSNAVIPKDSRGNWLLSITNDGWFGTTSGPYQHLQITRLRAVEEGLPLVRVSNPGISVVTDALGRVIATTELAAATVLDSDLPQMIDAKTLFSRKVLPLGSILWALLFVYLVLREIRNRRTSH